MVKDITTLGSISNRTRMGPFVPNLTAAQVNIKGTVVENGLKIRRSPSYINPWD